MKAYKIRDSKTGGFVTDGLGTMLNQAVIWFDIKDVKNFLTSLESQISMRRQVSQEEEFSGPPLPKSWEIVTIDFKESPAQPIQIHEFLKAARFVK